MKRFKLFSLVMMVICPAWAEEGPSEQKGVSFSVYQPILDRMPFGAAPTAEQLGAGKTSLSEMQLKAEQQKLAQKINMSAVNITPDGKTAIGFTDLSAKTPVNYYLMVGASSDGWTVKDADYDKETATIEKDGVEISLQLGKGLVETPVVSAAPGQSAPSSVVVPPPASTPPSSVLPMASVLARPPPPILQPGSSEKTPNEGGGSLLGSYRARLEERKLKQHEADQEKKRQEQEQIEKTAAAAVQNEIRKREEAALVEQQQDGATGDPQQEQQ